jgi:ribosomal protein L16 Arg81 hydroxylase
LSGIRSERVADQGTVAGVVRSHALPEWWRKEPIVRRGFLSAPDDGIERFFEWCREPAIARLYILTEQQKAGSAHAGELPSPEIVPKLYRQAAAKSEKLTILLNRVERVTQFGEELRETLPPGPNWRNDDVVATLSTPGSGIGFHAGHEDGYVVQLAGSRHWRVWHPDVLSDDYRWFLLGRGEDEYAVVQERPQGEPLLDVRLEPGDIMYLPALFPHEGITIGESVSASVAWRGFSPYSLLRRFAGAEITGALDRAAEAAPSAFFGLLPDPEAGDVVPDCLTDAIEAAVDLTALGIDPAELTRRLRSRIDTNDYL